MSKIYDYASDNVASDQFKETPKKLKAWVPTTFFTDRTPEPSGIFFERKENKFLITGILNNHLKQAKHL